MQVTFAPQLHHSRDGRCCGNFPLVLMHSKDRKKLNPDFLDILADFSSEKVEYLVVGGWALAFHGYVRATGDIDLWIRISRANAEKVWRALKRFGAPLFDLTLEDLLRPGMVYQMGVPPNRIDILNEITGVEFDVAWESKTFIQVDELSIPLIAKPLLIKNKRETDRPKDRSDVIWLESNDGDAS